MNKKIVIIKKIREKKYLSDRGTKSYSCIITKRTQICNGSVTQKDKNYVQLILTLYLKKDIKNYIHTNLCKINN